MPREQDRTALDDRVELVTRRGTDAIAETVTTIFNCAVAIDQRLERSLRRHARPTTLGLIAYAAVSVRPMAAGDGVCKGLGGDSLLIDPLGHLARMSIVREGQRRASSWLLHAGSDWW